MVTVYVADQKYRLPKNTHGCHFYSEWYRVKPRASRSMVAKLHLSRIQIQQNLPLLQFRQTNTGSLSGKRKGILCVTLRYFVEELEQTIYEYHVRASASSVALTPSRNVIGWIPSVWVSLVISMDMSGGEATPRLTWIIINGWGY